MIDASELLAAISDGGDEINEPNESVIDRIRCDDSFDIPVEMTDLELWANYTNEDLYQLDIRMREFLRKIRYKQENSGGYRTTASMVFLWMFGRKPTHRDSYICKMIHILLKYYCTSFTGKTSFHGKPVDRVYRFSKYAAKSKRPYSLRLRLEEAKDSRNVWRKSPIHDEDKRTHRGSKHSGDGEPETR